VNDDTFRELTEARMLERMNESRLERLARESRSARRRSRRPRWNVAIVGSILIRREATR
jgi:hypothetical protein